MENIQILYCVGRETETQKGVNGHVTDCTMRAHEAPSPEISRTTWLSAKGARCCQSKDPGVEFSISQPQANLLTQFGNWSPCR